MIQKASVILLIFAVIFSLNYGIVNAAGLVPCEGADDCNIDSLIGSGDSLLNRIVDFLLFYVAIPLATLSIAIAGFKIIIFADKPSERDATKKILWYAIIGLLLAFAAWLLVDVVLTGLVDDNVFNPPLE